MWQRGVHAEYRGPARAEKYLWQQAAEFNAARLRPTATFEPSKRYLKGVTGEIPVTTKETAGALPEIGNDHNIGFVISGAGFQPRLPLAHIVGCSQVCVSVISPNLQTTELVDQKEVNHAGDRVGAIHRRCAILQDIDVINHRKRKQVNVHTSAEPDGIQRTKGDTFSVHQHEGFVGQQSAQVELNRAVSTSAEVLVHSSARLLGQKSC